jgi:hypothetical protein
MPRIHRTPLVKQLGASLSLQLLLTLLTPYPQRTESFSSVYINSLQATISAVEEKETVTEYFGNEIGAELRKEQQKVAEICITDENDEGGILASLFGSVETRDAFFQEIYGHSVAYFPHSMRTLEPPISGLDLPALYESNEWTSLRKRGSHNILNKAEMSFNDLTDYIADGGSIVIPVTPDDYLFPTKLQIERALGVKEETGTTVNVYHSGPSAVALNIHYDAYPVFVLQLHGEKMWMIQNDSFGQKIGDVTDWKNVTMTEGDLLYIPKGVYHAATTAEGYSTTTHATIGLY